MKKQQLCVGSYRPSEDWSKYEHFAVMDESTGGLVASVGYRTLLDGTQVHCLEDYVEMADSIKQGHLYAHAHRLLDVVRRSVAGEEVRHEMSGLLIEIDNIEPVYRRMLGPNADKVIEHAKSVGI